MTTELNGKISMRQATVADRADAGLDDHDADQGTVVELDVPLDYLSDTDPLRDGLSDQQDAEIWPVTALLSLGSPRECHHANRCSVM